MKIRNIVLAGLLVGALLFFACPKAHALQGSAGGPGSTVPASITTGSITIPAIGSTVAVTVTSTASFSVGSIWNISDGTHSQVFEVSSVSSATGATLYNCGYPSLSSASAVIAAGVPVLPAGITTGTWTPTLVGSTTAGAYTYGAQYGFYQQFGRFFIAQFYMTWSAVGTQPSGNLTINGLPQTIPGSGGFADYYVNFGILFGGLTLASGYANMTAQLNPGTTKFSLVETGTAEGAILFNANGTNSLASNGNLGGTVTFQLY